VIQDLDDSSEQERWMAERAARLAELDARLVRDDDGDSAHEFFTAVPTGGFVKALG
jgi:hypothetical protein